MRNCQTADHFLRSPVLLLCSALALGALAAACGGSGPLLCYAAADCAAGESCVNGACQAGVADGGSTQPGAGALGAACSSRSDCTSPLTCIPAAAGFPSGYCSAACATSSCPSDAACADLTNTSLGAQACLASCSSAANCRSGYVCCPGMGNVCTPSGLCVSSGGGAGGGSGGGTGGGSGGGTGGGSGGGTGGGSGGGTGGGSGGGSTCTQTWTNYAKAAFSRNCTGCHGNFSNYSSVDSDLSSIRSKISSGSMPQGGWSTSSDKAGILAWIGCGAPQ